MAQQDLDFGDDPPSTQPVQLDDAQLESLLDLMGSIVIHVFNFQENQTREHTQESEQN